MGQGSAPLVFLHGLGGTIEDWAGTLKPLALNRRVIAIDMLGSGRTDKPVNCTYAPDLMRDHIISTLDALELDRFDLNGWSLGGRIALDVAHMVPQRVRRLVLTAPAGIGPDTMLDLNAPLHIALGQAIARPSASGWRILGNAFRSGGANRLMKFTARRVSLVTDAQSRVAFLGQLRSFVGASGFLAGPRHTLLQKLAQIDTPTLAVWGRQDNFAPFAHSAALTDQMPNCALHVVEQCGHMPHIEWPDIYTNAVDAFLR